MKKDKENSLKFVSDLIKVNQDVNRIVRTLEKLELYHWSKQMLEISSEITDALSDIAESFDTKDL